MKNISKIIARVTITVMLYVMLFVAISIGYYILHVKLQNIIQKTETKSCLLGYKKNRLYYLKETLPRKLNLEEEYHNLLHSQFFVSKCNSYVELVKKIKELQNKYALHDEIEANLVRKLISSEDKNYKLFFNISTYELCIKYLVPNFESLLSISSDIYALLPPGTIIAKHAIQEFDSITPKIMSNILLGKTDLIAVKMTFYLRNIDI